MVAAGLVTLYGRVGMISLGQIALLAIGTWTATRISYAADLPFPILLLVTGAITCGVGVLIGLPALRLSGLYLALITLMAAGAVNVVLTTINFPNGGHGFTGRTSTPDLSGLQPVGRPGIAEGDTAYYRYTIVVCALMFLLIAAHFASKPGRAWASIRESEPAALATGVNIVRYKLWAFALASFTTGVAGGLLAAQLGQPTAFGFPDAGLAHAARRGPDRRHLLALGSRHRRSVQPARAVPVPGAVGHRPELPADHLRRRPAAGAADGASRHRGADAQGSRQPRASSAVHLFRKVTGGSRSAE